MNEMTNVQNYDFLIKTLRKCGKQSPDRCWDCDYYDREPWCESALANDAAAALEAAEKRIAELERQHGEQLTRNVMLTARLPKEGEWIWEDSVCSPRICSVCKQKFYIGRGWNYCPNCGAKMRKGVKNEA